MTHVAIVGAGQAGAALAAKLRALGHDGPISLVGAEPLAPYQRPPLSKTYILGDTGLDRLLLRPDAFWREQGIALRTGARVAALEAAERRLVLEDGTTIAADVVALTTGSSPIRLPAAIGGDLRGVHTVRSVADADAMAPALVPGRRVLVVGGGYIGLEAAAVATMRGLDVVLVEMAPRILARVACEETAAWFRTLHEGRGVDIREGVGLSRLDGDSNGRVTAARLSDGTTLAVDLVVVGIGIRPRTGLAERAGLAVDNGVVVDALGATSVPGIYAAGDCTSFPHRGGRLRLESVPHAIEQAETVAAAMLGRAVPYVAKPWFWSDQYDVKLQIAGLGAGYDRIVARPGERAGSLSHWYYRGERLLAADAMNDGRAYMVAKRLIEAGRSPRPESVADASMPLRELMTTMSRAA